jgi:hypothetical protein
MPPVASEIQRLFVEVAGSDPVMQGLVAGAGSRSSTSPGPS